MEWFGPDFLKRDNHFMWWIDWINICIPLNIDQRTWTKWMCVQCKRHCLSTDIWAKEHNAFLLVWNHSLGVKHHIEMTAQMYFAIFNYSGFYYVFYSLSLLNEHASHKHTLFLNNFQFATNYWIAPSGSRIVFWVALHSFWRYSPCICSILSWFLRMDQCCHPPFLSRHGDAHFKLKWL